MKTIKDNLKLRKVGSRYMLVDVSDTDANITTVYTFNDTAAFIWNAAVADGTDPEILAARLTDEYDVDPSVALADTIHILEIWEKAGLLS